MTSSAAPELSVVVPTVGRASLLRTLESLALQRARDRMEVLVVGELRDAAIARAVGELAGRGLALRQLPVSFPDGDSSRKKNAGWQAARAPVIAFLDDDVVAPPEWAERVLEAFREPTIRIVSGPGEAPPGARGFARLGGLALSSAAAGYVAERYVGEGQSPRPAQWSRIIGCNMAWRREALEAVGGFDPTFWPGEEMIAAWRAVGRNVGGLVIHPGVRVFHEPRPTAAGFCRQVVGYGATRLRLIRAGAAVEWPTLLPGLALPLAMAIAVSAIWFRRAALALVCGAALYALFVLAAAAGVVRRTRRAADLAVALAIPLMHLAYGWGFWREALLPNRDLSLSAAQNQKR